MRTDDGKKKFRRWPPRVKRRRSPEFPPNRSEELRPDRPSREPNAERSDGPSLDHHGHTEAPAKAGENVRVTFRHRRRAAGDDHGAG